jgi:hypothetical protein
MNAYEKACTGYRVCTFGGSCGVLDRSAESEKRFECRSVCPA